MHVYPHHRFLRGLLRSHTCTHCMTNDNSHFIPRINHYSSNIRRYQTDFLALTHPATELDLRFSKLWSLIPIGYGLQAWKSLQYLIVILTGRCWMTVETGTLCRGNAKVNCEIVGSNLKGQTTSIVESSKLVDNRNFSRQRKVVRM